MYRVGIKAIKCVVETIGEFTLSRPKAAGDEVFKFGFFNDILQLCCPPCKISFEVAVGSLVITYTKNKSSTSRARRSNIRLSGADPRVVELDAVGPPCRQVVGDFEIRILDSILIMPVQKVLICLRCDDEFLRKIQRVCTVAAFLLILNEPAINFVLAQNVYVELAEDIVAQEPKPVFPPYRIWCLVIPSNAPSASRNRRDSPS